MFTAPCHHPGATSDRIARRQLLASAGRRFRNYLLAILAVMAMLYGFSWLQDKPLPITEAGLSAAFTAAALGLLLFELIYHTTHAVLGFLAGRLLPDLWASIVVPLATLVVTLLTMPPATTWAIGHLAQSLR